MHGLFYQPWNCISMRHGYHRSGMQLASSFLHSCSPSSLGPSRPSCPQAEASSAKALQPHTSKVERKRKIMEAACCRNTRTERASSSEATKTRPVCWCVLTLTPNPRLWGYLHLAFCPGCEPSHPRTFLGLMSFPAESTRADRSHLLLRASRFLTGYLSCTTNTDCWGKNWKPSPYSLPTLRTELLSASLVIRKSQWKRQSETCHRNPTPACCEPQQQPCKWDTVVCEIDLATSNKAEEASGVPGP